MGDRSQYLPLLEEKEDEQIAAVQSEFWSTKKILMTTATFGLVFLGFASQNDDRQLSIYNLFSSTDESINEEEGLIHQNDYERRFNRPLGNGVYGQYEHLVATHQETQFNLKSKSVATWSIKPPGKDKLFETVGLSDEILYTFPEVGEYKVKVVRDDGNEYTFSIDSRITRYELRDLSDEDRYKYLETLTRFYQIGDAEGKKLYGDTYMSWSAILRLHLHGAGSKECDHWHDDAGMFNHHIAITWVFEQSLRMINPTVASHYWDYTREFYTNTEWYDSDLFNDDWFGVNSPTNEDHILDSGRWAYTPVMSDARDYSGMVNPYGLLRSPWNTNPIPYVMRYDTTFTVTSDYFKNFPTCTDFADYVGDTLPVVSSAINGLLHGPIHIMIGGSFNQKLFWNKHKEIFWSHYGDDHLLLSKFMWRQGWIRTPESCSSDTPGEDCMPSCPSEITGDLTSVEVLMASRMFYQGMSWSDSLQATLLEDDAETGDYELISHDDLLAELCHVGYAGEMFTSAAPQDPTFWPLHGNAERFMLALQYYRDDSVIDFDTTWGYDHDQSASDTNLVCDWSNVEKITDMPVCSKGTCSGHKLDDLLPFTNFYMVDGLKEKYYTNAEFLEIFTYDNKNLPYVYDSVTYWEACTEQNLISEAAISTTTAEEKAAKRSSMMGSMRRRLNERARRV
jgi:hypothetical protein